MKNQNPKIAQCSNSAEKNAPVKNNSQLDSSLDISQLHAELHGLIMMPAEDAEIRESFRKRALEHSHAVGVANLTLDDEGNWDLKPGNSTGRVPRRQDFVEKFGKSCQATIQRRTIQMESFLGLQAVFVPVIVNGAAPEVLLILTKEAESKQTVFIAETVLEYYALWLRERKSSDNAWKLNSLAALVELVSAIEKTDDRTFASQTIANELVRYLNCEHAAVGLANGRRIRVQAMSGQAKTESSNRIDQLNETALSECLLRNEVGIWPAKEDDKVHLLLAHGQLADEMNYATIVSSPLTTPDGKVVGAVLIGAKQSLENNDRLFNFVRASAPRMASALEVVTRAEVSRFQKLVRLFRRQIETIEGRIWLGVGAVLLGLLCVPVPYRIRCSGDLNATYRQFAVAPFEGIVEEFHVEPGDMIEEGQLLASMDSRSIQFQLASVAAKLAKAKKQRDIELNRGDVPKSLVADLEAKSLSADENLLRHHESKVEIRSTMSGIVLADKFENSDGASVSKGDVLFEVGSYDPLTIEINIPADDIAHVELGQTARIWIDGYESRPILAKLQNVSPRSEMRDSRNVFVAEIELTNPDVRFRPGMKGHVRIDTSPKTLGWNLFHKPWNFLVSRLTWW